MGDLVAAGTALTVMIVEHPSLASSLKAGFNAYCEQWVNFEESRALATAEAAI